jgi:hypothetical protein
VVDKINAINNSSSRLFSESTPQINAKKKKKGKKEATYILLAATAADKFSIGTELMINRSSCFIQKYDSSKSNV